MVLKLISIPLVLLASASALTIPQNPLVTNTVRHIPFDPYCETGEAFSLDDCYAIADELSTRDGNFDGAHKKDCSIVLRSTGGFLENGVAADAIRSALDKCQGQSMVSPGEGGHINIFRCQVCMYGTCSYCSNQETMYGDNTVPPDNEQPNFKSRRANSGWDEIYYGDLGDEFHAYGLFNDGVAMEECTKMAQEYRIRQQPGDTYLLPLRGGAGTGCAISTDARKQGIRVPLEEIAGTVEEGLRAIKNVHGNIVNLPKLHIDKEDYSIDFGGICNEYGYGNINCRSTVPHE